MRRLYAAEALGRCRIMLAFASWSAFAPAVRTSAKIATDITVLPLRRTPCGT